MTPRAELLRGQRRDRRVGASQLERPDRLEGLGLEEPSQLGWSERHERRMRRDPAQALGRRADVLDAHQPHGRTRLHQRSRSAIRWQSMQRGAHGQRLESIDRDRAAAPDAGARTFRHPAARGPRRRARAGDRSDRAARGPAAGRTPGWPRRPAIRRSSDRARRSSRRARRPSRSRSASSAARTSSSGVVHPEMVRERILHGSTPEEAPWRPRSTRSAA